MTRARQVSLDMSGLRFALGSAMPEGQSFGGPTIALPLPGGSFREFTVERNATMSEGLRQAFPSIETYTITATDNPAHTGRLDVSMNGFHAVFDDTLGTVYIDPMGVGDAYQSYYKHDFASANRHSRPEFNCGVDHGAAGEGQNAFGSTHAIAQRFLSPRVVTSGSQLRTYRFAVAATGEYTAFHGGKDQTVAAIVTAVNRLNQILEREVSVRLQVIANNADVVFTDAATDPFTNDDSEKMIDEVREVLRNTIGDANYDIGHVFSTFGGGLAFLGAACRDSVKGGGVSGRSRPVNDPFVVDILAHEIGHQLAAAHTFNGTTNSCGNARRASAAYEPGSGTSIMAYAGICGNENLSFDTHDNYHIHSIGQMLDYLADTSRGGSCGVVTNLTNSVPVATAGPDGFIPASTPFFLTGGATDADAGDTLTYSWEQYDLGTETSGPADFVDDGTRPLFRVYAPTTDRTRVFPRMSDVLSGNTTIGEVLPTTDRELNMRFVVRDGRGGLASDSRKITVSKDAGPFTVTAPAGAVTWRAGTSETVTWDVANTTAAPISCANVDIRLSSNGGQFFGAPILTTANDGSEDIVVPNLPTTTARLMVKCSTQPFFDTNAQDFTIAASDAPNNPPVAQPDAYTVDQDSAATDLTVLANDTDADGDTLTIAAVRDISNGGTVTINGTAIRYQPAAGFFGAETFTYVVNDGKGGEATAQVTVTVNPPPNTAPVAQPDAFTVIQDSAAADLAVLANDTDADGDTLTIAAVRDISNGGSVTINGTAIRYQPAAGFSGTETFTYLVNDGRGGEASAQVMVTVNPPPNTAPVAANDTLTVEEGSAAVDVAVLANDTDADGDTLTIANVGTPSQGGTATVNGSAISYQPASTFSGTETFTYTVSDGRGAEATATVTVTVNAAPPPPPSPPPAAPAEDSGGGGVSFGPFLLLLMALGRTLRNTARRRRRRPGSAV
ncbi:MAG: Ig-like domain-containing protein [Pseudomonadota bacterium]